MFSLPLLASSSPGLQGSTPMLFSEGFIGTALTSSSKAHLPFISVWGGRDSLALLPWLSRISTFLPKSDSFLTNSLNILVKKSFENWSKCLILGLNFAVFVLFPSVSFYHVSIYYVSIYLPTYHLSKYHLSINQSINLSTIYYIYLSTYHLFFLSSIYHLSPLPFFFLFPIFISLYISLCLSVCLFYFCLYNWLFLISLSLFTYLCVSSLTLSATLSLCLCLSLPLPLCLLFVSVSLSQDLT